jgi:hypothetical protein
MTHERGTRRREKAVCVCARAQPEKALHNLSRVKERERVGPCIMGGPGVPFHRMEPHKATGDAWPPRCACAHDTKGDTDRGCRWQMQTNKSTTVDLAMLFPLSTGT